MASPTRSVSGLDSHVAVALSPPAAAVKSGNPVVHTTTTEVQQGVKEMSLNEQAQVEARGRLAAKFGTHTLAEYVTNVLPNSFCIDVQDVKDMLEHYRLNMNRLLQELVTVAKTYSRPPISKYHVGIAALGLSGKIYLGVNFEIKGCPLNQAIHGEQFLLINMRTHGETEIIKIALSAEPCGHCRQFINEADPKNEIEILTPEMAPQKFTELLPKPFGPKNLANPKHPERLLTPSLAAPFGGDSMRDMAIHAAQMGYAPHTEDISGVAVKMKNGKVYTGSYLENAAYNPSVSPLQAALVALIMDKARYEDIAEVVLAERIVNISQEDTTRMVLKKIAPEALAHFTTVEILAEDAVK